MNEIHEVVIEARIDGRDGNRSTMPRRHATRADSEIDMARIVDAVVKQVMQQLRDHPAGNNGRSW